MTVPFLLIVLSLTFSENTISAIEEKLSLPADQVEATGTVIYIHLEGGFFGIRGDDGRNYLPMDLPPEFAENGLKVRFSARIEDVLTTKMWGQPIRIISIERAQ